MALSLPSPPGRMQDEASWSPSPSPGMRTDLQPQRVTLLLWLPGLAKSVGHPRAASSSSREPWWLTWGEQAQSRRSPGAAPRPAARSAMRWLLRWSARCSCLMTLSAALRPAPLRTPPRALHLQCNVQSPAPPVQLPIATPSAMSCTSLPNAPAWALCTALQPPALFSAPPCTTRTRARPCAVLPRGALWL